MYNIDHDGRDEITVLDSHSGGGGGPYFDLSVYQGQTDNPYMFERIVDLPIWGFITGVYIDYKNIDFDGHTLYIDGKNVMEYRVK